MDEADRSHPGKAGSGSVGGIFIGARCPFCGNIVPLQHLACGGRCRNGNIISLQAGYGNRRAIGAAQVPCSGGSCGNVIGAPLVQHSVVCLLEFHKQGKISLEKIVEKMCHNPAILYQIDRRGYIREGYFADLTLVDLDSPWTVSKDNIHYKCGWSPLEGTTFHSQVLKTWVNGHQVFDQGSFDESVTGKALEKSKV